MDISLAGAESTRLQSQLIGSYNVPNMLAAAAVGLHFGVRPDSIIKAIEGYHPDNNRSEWRRIGSNDFVLDAYNANPSSVRAALNNFKALDRANKIIVLGDMLELGEFSEQEHRDIALQALGCGADLVVLVGPLFEAVKQEGALYFSNSEDAGADLANRQLTDCTLLIKGSRGIALEKVVEALR
jgi:UDP-N-acetylmuramoyl-tripeptide--D-alanyl-D-alanine ligase